VGFGLLTSGTWFPTFYYSPYYRLRLFKLGSAIPSQPLIFSPELMYSRIAILSLTSLFSDPTLLLPRLT